MRPPGGKFLGKFRTGSDRFTPAAGLPETLDRFPSHGLLQPPGYDYAMCTAVAYRPNCGWSTERCCHTLLVFENEIDDTGLGE